MQRASEARKIGRLPALARTPEHGARTRTPRTSQPWDVALDESPLTGGLDSLAMPTFARADVYGDDGGQQGDQDTDEDEEFVPHNSDTDSDAAYDDDAPDDAYAAADLIVARSGAGTVCEVSAVGLPAVYVPLPIGNGEQALNARPVVEAEGALLVRDDAFGRAWVQRQLIPLATDPERLARMGEAAARFGVRDADVTMAGLVRSAAQEGARR